jgi:hypothetical protein
VEDLLGVHEPHKTREKVDFNCIPLRGFKYFTCERNLHKTQHIRGSSIWYLIGLIETFLEKNWLQSEHCDKTGFLALAAFQSVLPIKQ